MNEIEIKVEGLAEAISGSGDMAKRLVATFQTGLMQVGVLAQSYAQESIIRGQKSGKVYKRGNISHQASAPGEAPASDTGRLASSFVIDQDVDAGTVTVTANIDYAADLEYGTSKMEARPFMRPAAEKAAQVGADLIAAQIKTAA